METLEVAAHVILAAAVTELAQQGGPAGQLDNVDSNGIAPLPC
jgi:hypothetical protein